jgi:anti-sigma regulatory factor (Ser/Thr protein kinase)
MFVTRYLNLHNRRALIDEAEVVVSELATNAVRHGGTDFSITLAEVGGEVQLTVSDDAPSVPEPRQPDVMALDGRGLLLVQELTTDWGVRVESGGRKSVWARLSMS